jgi:hypothetical protein
MNLPACVVGLLPSRFFCMARRIVSRSGICTFPLALFSLTSCKANSRRTVRIYPFGINGFSPSRHPFIGGQIVSCAPFVIAKVIGLSRETAHRGFIAASDPEFDDGRETPPTIVATLASDVLLVPSTHVCQANSRLASDERQQSYPLLRTRERCQG